MASFNKVILMGNLTRDPQLKYLPVADGRGEFGIAVNRKFKSGNGEEREEVTFVDVTSFGKQAEVFESVLHQGEPIFIEGAARIRHVGRPAGRREATQAVGHHREHSSSSVAGRTAAGARTPAAPTISASSPAHRSGRSASRRSNRSATRGSSRKTTSRFEEAPCRLAWRGGIGVVFGEE
jgi:single-strand DNA-binding protein